MCLGSCDWCVGPRLGLRARESEAFILYKTLAHATAIGMAYREKLDLAIAVALGSSTQIALFVIPLMVVVGWLLPGLDNDMTLDFPPFETTVTMLSVIIVAFQVQVGEVTYLSGFVLVVAYVIIALSFVYLHRKVEMIPVPGDPVRRALRGSAF